MDWTSPVVKKTTDTIRILAAEAVEKAKSGHPGLPMGAADYALVLWAKYLSFNPEDPQWPNRDRFVLSAGHGSILLYILLHLFGYDLSLDDLKNFRQWGSKTPGHPEHGIPGVETTTGPLGQGFANGVGMALAMKLVAARVNTPQFPALNHRVFAMVSDGDLMEGLSAEAASLAGHWGLGNLVYIHDDNDITIEGARSLSLSEDTAKRFEAYGWQVIKADGHDLAAMDRALGEACAETARPSLIMAKTRIGCGCPNKAGSADVHGAPLGGDELAAARQCLGWDQAEFTVPPEVRAFCRETLAPKQGAFRKWQEMLAAFRREEPEKAKRFDSFLSQELPADLPAKLLAAVGEKPVATRQASGACLQVLSKELPWLFGGSADLAPSNNTMIKGETAIGRDNFLGKNLHFGIREHALGGVMNGMALYGLIPYGGTFLVFADYMRPPIRLAAIMGLRVIYVFTHDSIFVGEDGPTHQPIEHLAALRIIPNLHLFRPADAAETAVAWAEAVARKDGPTALALSRQTIPLIDRKKYSGAEEAKRGGYVLAGNDNGAPDLILMGSGSEAALAFEVFEELAGKGMKLRAVSLPCWERFEAQDKKYQETVLPPSCGKRVAIEAGVEMGWHRWVGPDGLVLAMNRFGASAPYKILAEKFGFTKTAVLEMVKCTYPGLF